MNRFEAIRKEIEKIMPNSPLEFEPMHSKLTLKWLLKLKPDADESLRIAALAHDIDRAVTGITETYDLKDYSKIDEFKAEHAKRSAKIVCDLMKKHDYDKETIEKVNSLVLNHEVGGDEETNTLMDADSIAYFDYNISDYFKRNGKEKTKKKIKFMYRRISEKAKQEVKKIKFKKEVKELFQEAISELKQDEMP